MEKKIKQCICELNADADTRWENNRHLELQGWRDKGSSIELDLAIGKFEAALYSITATAEGWEINFSSTDNEESENILEDVMSVIYPCLVPARRTIGQQLRALRQERGYSTRQLAELTGLTHSHIVRIEAGKYNVGIDTLEKLILALGAELIIK